MPSLNDVALLGHLGQNPDIRTTKNGKTQANLSLATTDGYGENARTNWHRIVCWGSPADFARDYMHKGDLALVKGRLQYREYEDREGNKRKVTEIVAYLVQGLGRREAAVSVADTGEPVEDRKKVVESPKSEIYKPDPRLDPDPEADTDDDLPF